MSESKESTSNGMLVAYGLPAVGLHATGLVTSLYVLKFATEVLWIAPALVGTILLASRLWDAFNDPLIGHLSDRTRTRLGRRRPWMLGGAPLLAISFAAIWQAPGEPGSALRIISFAAAIVAFYTAYTLVSIPHSSLGATLCRDAKDRNRAYASRGIGQNVGMLVALVALYLFERGESVLETAGNVSLSVGVVSALAIGFGAWICREPGSSPEGSSADSPSTNTSRSGIRRSGLREIREVASNRSARLVLAVLGLQELALGALMVVLPFASDYILEAPGQTAFYLLAFVIPMTFSIPIWLRVGDGLGGLRAWRIGNVIEALGFSVIIFAGPGAQLLVLFAAATIGVGHGAGRVFAMSALAEAADEDAMRTGQAKEGLYFAASNFVEKCAVGMAAFGVGSALQISGFVAGQPPTEATVSVLRLISSLIPAGIIGASCILLYVREHRPAPISDRPERLENWVREGAATPEARS